MILPNVMTRASTTATVEAHVSSPTFPCNTVTGRAWQLSQDPRLEGNHGGRSKASAQEAIWALQPLCSIYMFARCWGVYASSSVFCDLFLVLPGDLHEGSPDLATGELQDSRGG